MSDKLEYLPMIPLRGLQVFPELVLNFDLERPFSIAAMNAAMEGDRRVFLTCQSDPEAEMPEEADLFRVGTVAEIRQILRIPGGGVRVLVQGLYRAELEKLLERFPHYRAEVRQLPELQSRETPRYWEALIRRTRGLVAHLTELLPENHPDFLGGIAGQHSPGYVADYLAQTLRFSPEDRQQILEEAEPVQRLELLDELLAHEIGVLEVEEQLQRKTQGRMAAAQREGILREQLRTIQMELGMDEEQEAASEMEEYSEKIEALEASEEVKEKLRKELNRLAHQGFGSSETAVLRTWLDTVLGLPWNVETEDRFDVAQTRLILDEDHFGLEKVKERILEFVAVRQLAPELKGTILCLVGPPGTGKTSIGKSIARALGRKLGRISLGGIHDEAEIRGHRKTYVGAMPGRIMTAVSQAGSRNPVLLLDEIDKLGSDYRGDPSAAMLEALDSEQNSSFRDHYLEVPFDLSDVLFITTANTTQTIPRPLLDRMEVIELSSYTDEEKLHIAKDHLLPKQRKRHGLKARELRLGDTAIREIISGWTEESGVRMLERELAAVCRKAAMRLVEGEAKSVGVKASELEKFLGVRRYKPEERRLEPAVGLARGLAWTSVGGVTLDVEVNVMDGTGRLELTGNLGKVMQESAQAALSYIRSRASVLGIDPEFYKKKDIHIHFPEGAVPKDGPSAGITITLAMISALTGAPVRGDLAMTGEITLRGRILAIGGLKEKTMAALRSGAKTVLIPADNEADLAEIDPDVRGALQFITAKHVDDVLRTALDFTGIQPWKPEEKPREAQAPAPLPEREEGSRPRPTVS